MVTFDEVIEEVEKPTHLGDGLANLKYEELPPLTEMPRA